MENQKLPNATAVLVLGILSIVSCCCYGIGLILGIVALVLAKKDIVLYNENPNLFNNYSNLKTGRILSIIGIVLSLLYLLFIVWILAVFGYEAMQNPEVLQERMRELMGQ